jgi:hypothetical protein
LILRVKSLIKLVSNIVRVGRRKQEKERKKNGDVLIDVRKKKGEKRKKEREK